MSGHMTAKGVLTEPPRTGPSNELDDPSDLEVTLQGHAAREASAGARLTGLSRGDFVIDSTIAGAAMARWESLGFRIVARDDQGREYELTPSHFGINPPPGLLH